MLLGFFYRFQFVTNLFNLNANPISKRSVILRGMMFPSLPLGGSDPNPYLFAFRGHTRNLLIMLGFNPDH